ncbi:jg25848 [Pararge aegeria aegeria]|uniref:Jg25848 protein n=1 Tax=Pararge aegeria aegeria TaxID=348720 RepID=A0A8S4QM02_9NEOP|nr:jg25848 [Pararge aegeria aegeria]
MDNKQLTVITLLDFSNAFNSVDFDILLGILRSLNISPSVINWFHSYLHGRQQRIRTEEAFSDWADLSAGVPQGGVLSPLLFTVFINEITKILTSHYHLYADDLQLYRHATLTDLDAAIFAINEDLNAIKDWAESFGLLVNPNKSQAMIIGSRQLRSRVTFNDLPPISYNGIPIVYSCTSKNLGLIIDSNLTWSAHINQVSKRMHYVVHSLRRLQNFLPLHTKIMLAQSLLLPILDYADVCYLDATEELLDKLERLQNLCIRFIFGLRKFDHVSDFRRQLKWLPIRFRRNVHILTVLYNILYNSSSPEYLCERIKLCLPPTRPLRSCVSKNPLDVPSYNTIFFQKSFSVHATHLWNLLPEHIRHCRSVHSFKHNVKEHYLSLS